MFPDLHWQDLFPQEHPNAQPASSSPFPECEGIVEVEMLAPGACVVYSFEIRRGEPFHFGASSNRRIAISITTFAEFERWTDSGAPFQELRSLQKHLGRLPKKICFRAGRTGCYHVVVANLTMRRAKVIVEAQSLT